MICISVAPTSRRLAKVDLLNASRQSDMIEFCLDHFIKEPDVAELMKGFDKPILISCRRPSEGGFFKGSEDERLKLLRHAIVAEPAYVELDFEIAKKIPRFGNTKRVVSFTSLDKPLGNVEELFETAIELNADVLKVTWPTPTLDAAWPMLVAVSKKTTIPVVGMGLGAAGLTFTLLGRKHGSPWTYAALEKGMEAYDGQPTVQDLGEIYGWQSIDSKTKFTGLVGLDKTTTRAANILNSGFQQAGLNQRCLPIRPGKLTQLQKMLIALKIKSLFVTPVFGSEIIRLADSNDNTVSRTGYADFLLKQPEGWKAYNSISRAILQLTEQALGNDAQPLSRRHTILIGTGELAQSAATVIQDQGGVFSISSPVDTDAQQFAKQLKVRHVPFAKLYETLAEVIVLADPTLKPGSRKEELNPALFQPNMTVLDLVNYPEVSEFGREAQERGCQVVETESLFQEQLAIQFKAITGQPLL